MTDNSVAQTLPDAGHQELLNWALVELDIVEL